LDQKCLGIQGIAVDPLSLYEQEACQSGLPGAGGVNTAKRIIAVHACAKMMRCSVNPGAVAPANRGTC
jgi:hypothetical protein